MGEFYFSVYTGDPSLLSFVNERAERFKSRNEYIWELIKKDKDGLVQWKNEAGTLKNELLEEIRNELRIISQAVGANVSPEQFEEIVEKTVEIGENVSSEKVIKILIEEGFL